VIEGRRHAERQVLSTALTQFIDNDAERETWEAEPPEIAIARTLVDEVDLAIVQRLKA
jgi:hypothetical protein